MNQVFLRWWAIPITAVVAGMIVALSQNREIPGFTVTMFVIAILMPVVYLWAQRQGNGAAQAQIPQPAQQQAAQATPVGQRQRVSAILGTAVGTIIYYVRAAFRTIENGIRWATAFVSPRLERGWGTMMASIDQRPWLWAAWILGILSLIFFGAWMVTKEILWLRWAFVAAVLTFAAGMTHKDKWDSVKEDREWWWFGVSLVGILAAFLFGASWWVIGWLVVSTILAAAVLMWGKDAVIAAFGTVVGWVAGMIVALFVWLVKLAGKAVDAFATWVADVLTGEKGLSAALFAAGLIAAAVCIASFFLGFSAKTIEIRGIALTVSMVSFVTATILLWGATITFGEKEFKKK